MVSLARPFSPAERRRLVRTVRSRAARTGRTLTEYEAAALEQIEAGGPTYDALDVELLETIGGE